MIILIQLNFISLVLHKAQNQRTPTSLICIFTCFLQCLKKKKEKIDVGSVNHFAHSTNGWITHAHLHAVLIKKCVVFYFAFNLIDNRYYNKFLRTGITHHSHAQITFKLAQAM